MTAIATSAEKANLNHRREGCQNGSQNFVEKISDWFLLSGGAILLLSGVDQVSLSIGQKQLLTFNDPIFGIPFYFVLILFGVGNLVIAALCLFTGKRVLLLGLVAWFVANACVYRLGLIQMGWTQPYPFVCHLTNPWGISERVAGVVQNVIMAYLLIGSGACLVALRRGVSIKESSKMSCPKCGGHIKFTLRNLGQKTLCPHCQTSIALRQADENLKTSCFFCNGHIEFPAHAIGTKLPCPHCKKDITLIEPK